MLTNASQMFLNSVSNFRNSPGSTDLELGRKDKQLLKRSLQIIRELNTDNGFFLGCRFLRIKIVLLLTLASCYIQRGINITQ